MTLVELFIISIGLSMDAFAVSVCKGLVMKKMNYYKALVIALFFGVFQALMPLFGFYIGRTFSDKITHVDHWVAFILLSMIGFNMIKESYSVEDINLVDDLYIGELILLSIATSIDALAIGVTFAFLEVEIAYATLMIGIITFLVCFMGVKIGNIFGSHLKAKAEFFGGMVLIVMALKIILDHLFF